MEALLIRAAQAADLPRITEIYNHYVLHTPVTFDLEPYTVEAREPWFDQFRNDGRHRLWVALRGGQLAGYAGTHTFRTKQAYETTVETTVYCAPEHVGAGIGSALYRVLFQALAEEDIHSFIAGVTLPNAASLILHERFGFSSCGVMHAVGRKFEQYWDVGWLEKLVTK